MGHALDLESSRLDSLEHLHLLSHEHDLAKPSRSHHEAFQRKPDEKENPGVLDDIISVVSHATEGQLNRSQHHDVAALMGVKRNAEGDTDALISALVFGTVLLVITVATFMWLRRCLPFIYAHRVLESDPRHGAMALPASHGGLFGWAIAAWNVTDEQVMEAAGLDALMFLEFCRLLQRLMLIISPLVIGILCPMHYYCSQAGPSDELLGRLGILGLLAGYGQEPRSAAPLWVHASMVWIIVLLTLHLTNNTHLHFLKYRFQWLGNIPEPRSTTLMVESIPEEYRSDEKLKAYFVHLFTEAAIGHAYIVRKTDTLCEKVAELELNQHYLMLAERQWEKDGKDPAKVPKMSSSWVSLARFSNEPAQSAIEVYSREVQDLKAEVSRERAHVDEAAAKSDPAVVSSSGFVTFTSQRWCRHASREQFREDTQEWVVGMAPDPTDVVYKDLAKDKLAQTRGNVIATVLLVVVFLVWTPLVALSSSLVSLPKLQKFFPLLVHFVAHYPMANSLLHGVLATFALKFLMSWLPTILMTIIREFWTLKAGAWAQLKLQSRLFIFQVTFVLFITTVGVSLQRSLTRIIHNPKEVVSLLAETLPEASHFYLNYVLLAWFTVAMELLRYFQCAQYLWYTLVSGMSSEKAREAGEPEDQDSFGLGARFGKVALIMTLALVFSTVMPLITLFAFIYFFLCNICYAYLLVFAETRKPDLGGAFWIVSLRHILFALIVYVTLMVGILSSTSADASGRSPGRYPAVAIAPVFLVLFLAWRRLGQLNWEILPFETLADTDHEHGKTRSIWAGIYMQPECRNTDQDLD